MLLLWWRGTARARDPREHGFFGGREGVGEASWEESMDGRGLGFTSGPRWADSVAKGQGFAWHIAGVCVCVSLSCWRL